MDKSLSLICSDPFIYSYHSSGENMRNRLYQYAGVLGGGFIAVMYLPYKQYYPKPEKKIAAKEHIIDESEIKHLRSENGDIKVVPVSQHKFSDREGFGGGICLGLSTMHIVRQLNSNFGPCNPFRAFYTVDDGFALQHKLHGRTGNLPDTLDSGKLLLTQGAKVLDLEDELNKTIQNTVKDGKGRGVLINGVSRRFSSNEDPFGHAISMTTQKINGKLSCTGLDPNFFFASGNGLNGCHEVAKRIKQTVEFYEFQENLAAHHAIKPFS
jgi:hypothetical protein